MRAAAWIVFFAGLGGLIYALQMETTVAVPGETRRVVNLGLMDDRRTALILSGLAILVGVIVGSTALLKPKAEKLRPNPPSDPAIDPNDWQDQHAEISPQRAEWAARHRR